MSLPRLRPLGFGEILDEAFALYRHHFVPFFTATLLAVIPLTLLSRGFENAMLATEGTDSSTTAAIASLVLVPLVLLLWAILWGVLTHQTAEAYQGGSTPIGPAYARAVRRLPAIIGGSVLIGLLSMALTAAVFVVGFLTIALPLAFMGGDGETTPAILGAAFAVLIAVATIVAMTSLFAFLPAIVVEQLGPWSAIKRSHALAKGGRLRIIGIAIVTTVIVTLPTIGLMVAGGMGSAMWDVSAAATLSPTQRFIQQFVTILATSLTTPFMIACFTLLYFDRRVRAEGYDLELAADALAAQAPS